MTVFTLLHQLFQQKKYREVLEYVSTQSIALDFDPLAAQVVAASNFQLGEFTVASTILEIHEASLSNDVSFLSLFGATLRRLGNLPKARMLLEKALEVDPHSQAVRNNYANLLIDLDELPRAREILEDILSENESNTDARSNLARLVQIHSRNNLITSSRSSIDSEAWVPGDPLMLAFAEEEVSKAGSVNFTKEESQSASKLASKLPSPDKAANAADQLALASKSNQENNPTFALQLISHAYKDVGSQSSVYMNAGDTYILLKRFHEAEICFLHSLELSGRSIPAYINLSTLACMRGDVSLAQHYLDAASSIDPKHPQIANLQKQISNSSSLKPSTYIFQESWTSLEVTQVPN